MNFDEMLDIGTRVYSMTANELDVRVETVRTMMVHCDCIDSLSEGVRIEALLLYTRINDMEFELYDHPDMVRIIAGIEEILKNCNEIREIEPTC